MNKFSPDISRGWCYNVKGANNNDICMKKPDPIWPFKTCQWQNCPSKAWEALKNNEITNIPAAAASSLKWTNWANV